MSDPRCYDSRNCFAKKMKKNGKGINTAYCSILKPRLKGRNYDDGMCPFCKESKSDCNSYLPTCGK